MAGVINEKREKMNINEKVYQMGVEPSVIREIFAFGCERAAVIGAENVMDFSIGNPSVPAPKEVQDTIIRIINNLQPKEYHSYTPGPGAPATRKAIADNLNKRFCSNFGPEDLYMTCGAAASLSIVLKTLIAKETDEIAVVIPFFPEYTAFIKAQGGIPVQIQPAEDLTLDLEKLEAMTTVCSVGLDMIAIPGDTPATTVSGILADEFAIGMVNNKTTACRLIPAPGKKAGDWVEFGGLLGGCPVMPVSKFGCADFINRGGRIPAPIHSPIHRPPQGSLPPRSPAGRRRPFASR